MEFLACGRQYRDLTGWQAYGVVPSTPSDQACKLYDAAVYGYYRWGCTPDPASPIAALEAAVALDEHFVTAHVAIAALLVASSGSPAVSAGSPAVSKALANAAAGLRHGRSIQPWEELLMQGTIHAAHGRLQRAVECWEEVLLLEPCEPLSLKLLHDLYFLLGQSRQMRDSIARVIEQYDASRHGQSIYGNVRGMYSFALEECGDYGRAHMYATEALELDRLDSWATHARFHVFEMQGKAERGLEFGLATESEWSQSPNLMCHNYWHMALYHVRLGRGSEALELFRRRIEPRAVASGEMLDLVDASALLYRLELAGMSVERELYRPLVRVWETHIDDHFSVFNDTHLLMTMLGSGSDCGALQSRFFESARAFVADDGERECEVTNRGLTRRIGLPLMDAMVAFNEHDYAKSVRLLEPLRYDMVNIGGSHAQRDVYELLLLKAAMHCNDERERRLARALLAERHQNNRSMVVDHLAGDHHQQ